MPRNTPSEQYGKGSELLHKLNKAVENAQSNKPCKLCAALDSLDAATAEGVRRAIAAKRPDGRRALGSKTLTKLLQEDLQVSQYMIERHLRENHE